MFCPFVVVHDGWDQAINDQKPYIASVTNLPRRRNRLFRLALDSRVQDEWSFVK